jgi:hypothetical protein
MCPENCRWEIQLTIKPGKSDPPSPPSDKVEASRCANTAESNSARAIDIPKEESLGAASYKEPYHIHTVTKLFRPIADS